VDTQAPVGNADDAQRMISLLPSFSQFPESFTYTLSDLSSETVSVASYVSKFEENSFQSSFVEGEDGVLSIIGGQLTQITATSFSDSYSVTLEDLSTKSSALVALPIVVTERGSEVGGSAPLLMKYCYFSTISDLLITHSRLYQTDYAVSGYAMGIAFQNYFGPLFLE